MYFTPDAQQLVHSSAGELLVWNLRTGEREVGVEAVGL